MDPRTERFLQAAVVFLAVLIASVAIPQVADTLTDLSHHIRHLFRRARLFNADFFQLMLITVFVGWAISRITRAGRK